MQMLAGWSHPTTEMEAVRTDLGTLEHCLKHCLTSKFGPLCKLQVMLLSRQHTKRINNNVPYNFKGFATSNSTIFDILPKYHKVR